MNVQVFDDVTTSSMYIHLNREKVFKELFKYSVLEFRRKSNSRKILNNSITAIVHITPFGDRNRK